MFSLKKNIIMIQLFVLILTNISCNKSNKILFQIKDKEVKINTYNKTENINFENDINYISNNFKSQKSHEIEGGDFYTLTPYPIEYGVPWKSDKALYIVIYFDNKGISKYSEKFDDIEITIDINNKNLKFDNKMNIEDIKNIFYKNNIEYESSGKYLLEIKQDKIIRVSYDPKSKNIFKFFIYFEKEEKKENKEPKIVP